MRRLDNRQSPLDRVRQLRLGGLHAGFCVDRRRVRCVAAVSPPFSVDVYWNVTLFSMRRELASLYDMRIEEMDRFIPRITQHGRA